MVQLTLCKWLNSTQPLLPWRFAITGYPVGIEASTLMGFEYFYKSWDVHPKARAPNLFS